MNDMAYSTAVKMKKGADSICRKCLHLPVCRYIPPFPCIECYQFSPAVVRCKVCKHWEEPYCMLCKTRIGTSYHSRDMAYRKSDDFCSYGERKDGE